MNFEDVDQRYQELKQQYLAGTLAAEQFDEQLRAMMVQDNQGRWWAKSRESGDWHYYDVAGSSWIRADPPAGSSAPTLPPPPLAPAQAQQVTGSGEIPAVQTGEPQMSAVPPAAQQPVWAKTASPQPVASQTADVPPPTYSGPRTLGPMPELSSGLKVFFYIISFLVPIVGIILFFVYRGKPAPEDRSAARIFLILGIISLALTCICPTAAYLSLASVFMGNSPF